MDAICYYITGVYLGIVTMLSALGIFLTVLILIMFHRAGSPKPSSAIMSITRVATRVTCSSVRIGPPMSNSVTPVQEAEDEKNDSKPEVIDDVTWNEVAVILDKFCFLVFFIVTVTMNVSFVLALVIGGKLNAP